MNFRREIELALSAGRVVRVYRDGLENGWAHGFISAVGPEFFALESIDEGVRFNGFECLRYKDVSDFKSPDPSAAFVEKVLKIRGLVRQSASFNLSSVPDLLRTAGAAFPVVTLHLEGPDDGVCYIGKVKAVTEFTAHLLEVSPDGKWDTAPTPYQLADITRVDFGGAYEEALFLAASLS